MIRHGLCLALAAVALAGALSAHAAGESLDFSLGKNAEGQACRAVARFDAPKGAKAADVYCGAWERPSGRITVYADDPGGQAALAAACKGNATQLQSPEFSTLSQVACDHSDKSAIQRYALIAHRSGKVAVGDVYPSDWAPLVNAARVLTGAASPVAVASAESGQTPGLSEIQSVFPSGPPGQNAAYSYELLRRRAYEYNQMWEFGASERDFEEVLRAQERLEPDDLAGQADILAEIGLNMSSARRFDEANATLARADALARSAKDALLVSKIENYRALDQLNQRRFNAALGLALAANRERAALAGGAGGEGAVISAGDASRVDGTATSRQRSLLISFGQATPAERSAVLTAQADYIAGVAALDLGLPAATGYLDAASSALQRVGSPPERLVAEIAEQRAALAIASHAFTQAAAIAQDGLAIIRTVAPGTRSEAHLWLTLERAQAGMGQAAEALASGRTAIDIYAKQSESPGLPPDVAAPHLALLEQEWRRTGDAALAGEYFRTISLVWGGAAAKTTALLAARLALRDAAGPARAYQDAQRIYRAAYARRQQLAGNSDAPSQDVAQADAAVRKAAADLAAAESDLRGRAPAYLELLSPQVSPADLQSVLADHEAYLRLVMSSQGGFGVLVDKAGAHPFQAAIDADQVDKLVDGLRRTTRLRRRLLPDYDTEAAQKLYAALIAPVQDRLADVKDLDVDVSGSLASIPFTSLIVTPLTPEQADKISSDQDYSSVDWLARHWTVVNALGPASFVRLRKESPPPATKLSVVAYGDFLPDPAEAAARIAAAESLSDACRSEMARSLSSLGALPDTADEARSVASIFPNSRVVLGKAFTDVDFLTDTATASADVILLATHGVLAISPCFPQPALLTSVGATGVGLIEAATLLDRQLKARLVLLSACDTAAGGKLDAARTGLDDGGDALSGLARAFIYAGARDVLATEWKVDAETSKAEINGLLKEAQGGKPIRTALSDAEAAVYSQAETGHPFYWAAFILVGDGVGQLGGGPPPQAVAAR